MIDNFIPIQDKGSNTEQLNYCKKGNVSCLLMRQKPNKSIRHLKNNTGLQV